MNGRHGDGGKGGRERMMREPARVADANVEGARKERGQGRIRGYGDKPGQGRLVDGRRRG